MEQGMDEPKKLVVVRGQLVTIWPTGEVDVSFEGREGDGKPLVVTFDGLNVIDCPKELHKSDCAVQNEPALPPKACTCGALTHYAICECCGSKVWVWD